MKYIQNTSKTRFYSLGRKMEGKKKKSKKEKEKKKKEEKNTRLFKIHIKFAC